MAQNKILIVDDDAVIRELLSVMTASFGLEPVTADDGADAMAILEREEFPIVITDMKMPNMDGMELLKHIRATYPNTEVIVITGYGDQFSYTDVIEAGASDFLKKPFRENELAAKLNRVAREQTLIRQLNEIRETLEQQVQEKNVNLTETKEELQRALERISELQSQMIRVKYGPAQTQPNPYFTQAVAKPVGRKPPTNEEPK